MKSDIAITTVSWIRTNDEASVVLQTIQLLNKLNIPIIIVDAGSSLENIKYIRKNSNVILLESKKGLTEQLILSHKEAQKYGNYLFYLHTDKLDFARDTAKKMIDRYRNTINKGMLIPTRTKESMDTYPSYQKTQEAFLNFFMSDYIGILNDYFAGPKIYPASLVKYLDYVPKDGGWGIESYFYVLAKRLGMIFDFLPFYMKAPKDVDNEEKTKQYRLQITAWQIECYLKALNLPL